MKLFDRIIFTVVGIVFACVGIYTLYLNFTQEFEMKLFFIGLMMTVMGIVFVVFSGKIAQSNSEERAKHKPNKYVIRQLLLFLGLMYVYIFFCIYTLDRYSKLGKDVSQVLKVAGIGFVGIMVGLGILTYNAIRQRKMNKIHDRSFENSKIHKNNSLFTMIIDYCWFDEGKTYFRGFVHGAVELNDEVYFYYPLDQAYSGKIIDIQKEGKSKKKAEDERCTMAIETSQPITFPFLTLCTSIIPFGNKSTESIIVNPEVLGLINAYDEQINKDGFFGALVYEIVHGNYLVRVKPVDASNNIFSKIIEFFFGYRGAYNIELVTNEYDIEAIPVYTDWNTLKKGLETLSEEDKKISQAMVMSFDEIQKTAKRINHTIVINPFNKENSFHLSRELIDDIVNSSDYQKEFGKQTD